MNYLKKQKKSKSILTKCPGLEALHFLSFFVELYMRNKYLAQRFSIEG